MVYRIGAMTIAKSISSHAHEHSDLWACGVKGNCEGGGGKGVDVELRLQVGHERQLLVRIGRSPNARAGHRHGGLHGYAVHGLELEGEAGRG